MNVNAVLSVFYGCLIGLAVIAYVSKQEKQHTFHLSMIYIVLSLASMAIGFSASAWAHVAIAAIVALVTFTAWRTFCYTRPLNWYAAIVLPLCMTVVYASAVMFAELIVTATTHGIEVKYIVLPLVTLGCLFLTHTQPGTWLWHKTGLKSRY